MRVGLLATHPVQYYTPWFRALASRIQLEVYYAHNPSGREIGEVGFGKSFEWDVDLMGGYASTYLSNQARMPTVDDQSFFGCDIPSIRDHIRRDAFSAFIVLGWHSKAFWQAVLACRQTGTPVVARGDSQYDNSTPSWERGVKKVTHGALLRAFNGFLAVGSRFEAYLRHYGVSEDLIYRVPHSVDVERFARQAESARRNGDVAQLRSHFDASDEIVALLFVGKMIPKKDPVAFLEAVRRAAAEGVPVRGIMVGTGPLESELRKRRNETGAPVRFAGFRNQTELPAFYALADALVLPSLSRSESWGLVVNEAMACGTPALVSKAAGCSPDMIEEGKTGYTFPAGDVVALTDRIKQIVCDIQGGRSFRPGLVAKTEEHSPKTAADRTEAALRRIIDRP